MSKNRKRLAKIASASAVEPKWSPYGCHYYPDMTEFPDPRVETLPEEPLQSGEQYFLDLGGNIKKGPSGHGSTCYCAPFIHRYVTRVSVQGVKSLGGHFACLCRGFEFYEVKENCYYFSKRKWKYFYTFNHFYSEKSSKRAK